MVDLKFTDLLGTWQHVSLPLPALDESAFDEGLGFDGSSIRGWKGIQESDMLLIPDASTAMLDPFTAESTLSLVCDVQDPITREDYDRDPRLIAQRAEAYLVETGIADTVYFGPEAEFFVFDDVSLQPRAELRPLRGRFERGLLELGPAGRRLHDPREARLLPGLAARHVQRSAHRDGADLERLGIACEYHHHEVATAGQCEIDMRFTTLTRMADQLMTYKYVVRNVANRAGKTATFMPKPIFGDNGSGMHCHQSIWKDGQTLMADDQGYAGLSATARGVRRRAAPTRAGAARIRSADDELVPPARPWLRGAGEPRLLAAQPLGVHPDPGLLALAEGQADRVPLPRPDGQSVPRLLGDAARGHRRDRKGPRPGPSGRLRPVRGGQRGIPQVPGSLAESLDALEADHEFLLAGGVFTESLIQTWIDWKRESEVDSVRLRPHPLEFAALLRRVMRTTSSSDEETAAQGRNKSSMEG